MGCGCWWCRCIPSHLSVAAHYFNLEERRDGFRELLEGGIDTPGKDTVIEPEWSRNTVFLNSTGSLPCLGCKMAPPLISGQTVLIVLRRQENAVLSKKYTTFPYLHSLVSENPLPLPDKCVMLMCIDTLLATALSIEMSVTLY